MEAVILGRDGMLGIAHLPGQTLIWSNSSSPTCSKNEPL